MRDVLRGVKVVEVAQWWLAPIGATLLGEWGADVVKVEHPLHGDPLRGLTTAGTLPGEFGLNFMFEQANHGKRSLGLDLSRPAGREILDRLIREADVFVTSFLPSVRAPAARRRRRAGRQPAHHLRPVARRRRPRAGTGPGRLRLGPVLGARRRRPPPDAAGRRGAGRAAPVVRRRHQRPVAGGRDRRGAVRPGAARRAVGSRRVAARHGDVGDGPGCVRGGAHPRRPARGAPRNPGEPLTSCFRTADDRWIWLALLQADRHWPELCARLDRPGLVTDPRFAAAADRAANLTACLAELDALFAARPLAEWRRRLDGMSGVWAVVQAAEELLNDPQVLANGYAPEVGYGDRAHRLVAGPAQFDGGPADLSPAPAAGEHTDEILQELGDEYDKIISLKIDGVVN